MKKKQIIIISSSLILGAVIVSVIVNFLFKIDGGSFLEAEWDAGDALNYVAAIAGAISTFVLGVVAYKQNDKLQYMEENNFIAANSSMLVIDEIKIKPKISIPCYYKIHSEQILIDKENHEKSPSGYSCSLKCSKIGEAVPAMIHIIDGMLIGGDSNERSMDCCIFMENVFMDKYSRVAIGKDNVQFGFTLIVRKDEQEKFKQAIQKKNNELCLEFNFDIVTDKYVVTKCKCRSYFTYSSYNNDVTWTCKEPMVFFKGHDIIEKSTIKIAGEDESNG